MLRRLYCQIIFGVALAAPSFAATGFLDTPDSCMALQGIEGQTVYLQRVGSCKGKPGRVFVEVQAGEIREVVVDGRTLGRQQVKRLEIADVTGVLDKSAKIGEKMMLPDNPHAATMQKMAEDTKAVYDSSEFQQKLRAETERIKTATIGDQFDAYYRDAAKEINEAAHLGEDERLYIFISASMPMPVLREYAADAAHLGDSRVSLVLRGFVDGMNRITPTAHMIAEMLKKNPSCELSATHKCEMQRVEVMVDPLLYRRYGIQQVPSFVYAKGIKATNPAMSEGDVSNAQQSGETYRLAGDASLKYVVAKLQEETGSASLKEMVGKLR